MFVTWGYVACTSGRETDEAHWMVRFQRDLRKSLPNSVHLEPYVLPFSAMLPLIDAVIKDMEKK